MDTQANKRKILIVDDVPKNIELAANILQTKNYNITFAKSGPIALEKVKSIQFDLILLDVMMPEMDGFEVCKILKDDDATKDIPVIFLTARSETENVVKGFELGAVDYVTKPFQTEELLARVKTHVDIREKLEEKKAIEKQLKNDGAGEGDAYTEDLKKQLESRKAELENVTLFYELRSQMDKLIQDKSPVARMEIRHIKEMISNLFIDKSNQEFHRSLKQNFPKLTFDDMRLCSYLKQRFLNVEIAEFLETSPEAVYTRKSRLRQKLNLTKDEDITDFLANFTY
ncbi:MAG: response regulator [Bacteroidales bacterium]|nr:response regulator [Bacteroidales bacterium]